MFQTKEQGKTPEELLSEVEIGNLPEKEFRGMIVKMIQDLRKRREAQTEKIQEMFNKELEDLKNEQREMNDTIIGMKNTLEGISRRKNEAEERISELKDILVEIIVADQNNEMRFHLFLLCLCLFLLLFFLTSLVSLLPSFTYKETEAQHD